MSLADCYSVVALAHVRRAVKQCEARNVDLLCCPEGALGGLADYVVDPLKIAMHADSEALAHVAETLGSTSVTSIVGFTEIDDHDRLFNSAAIIRRGLILGVYRKRHPAINRSVYQPGEMLSAFVVSKVTLGILICRDSTFPADARALAAQGATAIFIPTNNGLPPAKGGAELVADARRGDADIAQTLGVCVIRADVAGHTPTMVSHGSSGIHARDGSLLASARELEQELIVADIESVSLD